MKAFGMPRSAMVSGIRRFMAAKSSKTSLTFDQLSEDLFASEESEAIEELYEEEIERAKVTTSDITASDGLQTEIVENALKIILRDLESFYQKLLWKKPYLTGKVVVTFVISSTNRAKNVKIVSSELHERKIEKYLVKQIEKLHFPPRADRSEVTVSCAFNFEVV
jgi:hypothetical protein